MACLDELIQAVQEIGGTEPPPEGTVNISVSAEASAEAAQQSVNVAIAQAQAAAFAYAEASAIALNILNVDLRVDLTNVITLKLPPLTVGGTAPNLTDYPSAETGVTDTPTTTVYNGEMCQLIYAYLFGMREFLRYLRDWPALAAVFSSPLVIVSQMEVILKLIAQFTDSSLLVSGDLLTAMAAYLAQVKYSGRDPVELLDYCAETVLADGSIDMIACNLYNFLVVDEMNTLLAQKAIIDFITTEAGGDEDVRAIMSFLLSPTIMSASIYVPANFAIPSTTYQCDLCGV